MLDREWPGSQTRKQQWHYADMSSHLQMDVINSFLKTRSGECGEGDRGKKVGMEMDTWKHYPSTHPHPAILMLSRHLKWCLLIFSTTTHPAPYRPQHLPGAKYNYVESLPFSRDNTFLEFSQFAIPLLSMKERPLVTNFKEMILCHREEKQKQRVVLLVSFTERHSFTALKNALDLFVYEC